VSEVRQERSVATIREVAYLAGVSVSTVSRVVTDHPDVRPETRTRVREAIQKLQYRPSALARGLILGRAKILGLLVSDVTNPFYPELVRAIESTARERGYSIILCATEDDPAQSSASLGILGDFLVAGIIHASVAINDPDLPSFGGPGSAPIVFVNRTADVPTASSITVDNRTGARLAVQHLVGLDRRNLMHLAGPAWASNAVARQEGFLEEVEQAGIDGHVVEVGFMIEDARTRFKTALERGPLPDGIFAVNDSIAIAAMEELVSRGVRVPEDVAVIGFDDTHLSASPFIQLSTIAHNVQAMGKLAADLMISFLEEQTEEWPQRIVLPPRLVVRGSTVKGEQR
jgi:LacI family transcriptional regulator